MMVFSQNNISDLQLIDTKTDQFQVGIYNPNSIESQSHPTQTLEGFQVYTKKLEPSQLVNPIFELETKDILLWKFSNSERYLIYTTKDYHLGSDVILWDLVENRKIRLFSSNYKVNTITFSTDDKLVALGTKKLGWTGYSNSNLYLIDLTNFTTKVFEEFPSETFINLKFTNDSSILMLQLRFSDYRGEWDKVAFLDVQNSSFFGDVNFNGTINFDPELKLLAYYNNSQQQINLFDVKNNKLIFSKSTYEGKSRIVPLVQPLTGNLMYINENKDDLIIFDRVTGNLIYEGASYLDKERHYEPFYSKFSIGNVLKYYEYITMDISEKILPNVSKPQTPHTVIEKVAVNNNGSKVIIITHIFDIEGRNDYRLELFDVTEKKRILVKIVDEKLTPFFFNDQPFLIKYESTEEDDGGIAHIYAVNGSLDYLASLYPFDPDNSYIDTELNRIVTTKYSSDGTNNYNFQTNIVGIQRMKIIDSINFQLKNFSFDDIGVPFLLGNEDIIIPKISYDEQGSNKQIYNYKLNRQGNYLNELWGIYSFTDANQKFIVAGTANNWLESKTIIYDFLSSKTFSEITNSNSIKITDNGKYIIQERPYTTDGHDVLPDFLIRKLINPTESIPVLLNSKEVIRWNISNTTLVVANTDKNIMVIDLETGKTKLTFRSLIDRNYFGWDDKEIFYTTPDYTDYITIFDENFQFDANRVDPFFRRTAVVNDGPLNMRDKPSLDGNKVGYMPTNMGMLIYEKSNEKMKIGEYNDYWYRVAAENGFHGWCYGAFITLDEK